MLDRINIQNIALIKELALELSYGLNILSGETGAGKSIIIDSLNFVLGERADKSLIRHGENYARVEAHFTIDSKPNVAKYIQDLGIEIDTEIIISRIMTENGKNECRINGRLVTLGVLKGLTSMLTDIHGQHEHQSLLNTDSHLCLLDRFSEKQIGALLDFFKKLYHQYLDIKAQLDSFMSTSDRAQKLDILSYQIEEIEKASIKENEEEDLLILRNKLHNNEKYIIALNSSVELLSEDENSVSVSIGQAIKSLNQITDIEPILFDILDRLNSVKIEIKDISSTLSDLLENGDNITMTIDELEKRLSLVRLIKKKYGKTEKDISLYYNSAKAEYERLSESESIINKLEKNLLITKKEMLAAANNLSDSRKEAAKRFEDSIIKNLVELGMKNTVFKVDFKEDINAENRLSEDGIDKVEFLISPNLGEPLKPLSKIISGGEMSRFMLGLKNITSELDGIDTMVFDEIDTGISGKIALTVAEKLYNISRGRQVIAVTHLPQLASMADRHYLIGKDVVGDSTLTFIELLDEEGRVKELTRLVGGKSDSVFAESHAKELISNANAYKAGQLF